MRLYRFAQLTAGWLLLTVFAGGLVTSMDAGLAVPDWPLSYGTLFPPMVGGIRYEHSHRLIAGVAALLIAGLAVWLWRVEPRRWVRRAGAAACLGVLTQAILGGLTVLLVLPAPISIAHACLGPLVLSLVAGIAWATAPSFGIAQDGALSGVEGAPSRPSSATADPVVRMLSLGLAGACLLQLLLGAIIRHTGGGVAPHLLGALLAASLAAALAVRARRAPCAQLFRRLTAGLAAGIMGQLLLGLAAWAHRDRAVITALHQAVGAVLLAGSGMLALAAWSPHLPLSAGPAPKAQIRLRRMRQVGGRRLAADYLALTKPRLTLLAVMAAGVGFLMGAPRPLDWGVLIHALVGAALVGGGANTLNQWMERDADALMRRTRHRPLPAKRLSPASACVFGAALSMLGILWLGLATHVLAAALGLLTLATYLGLYTPLKRVTPLCTLAGAIPGALPPLIGWAAGRGTLGAGAWALFAILFLWQLPHFLALAWVHRDDYARAGFRMLPVLDPDGISTGRQMVLAGLALVPASLFPTILGLAGPAYFLGAALAGMWFLGITMLAARRRSHALAGRVFATSISYLPLVLGLMVIDRTPI